MVNLSIFKFCKIIIISLKMKLKFNNITRIK